MAPVTNEYSAEPARAVMDREVRLSEAAVRRRGRARGLFLLCRPHHWSKNTFVLAPLLFAGMLGNTAALVDGVCAFACFCLWSSVVYAFNDVVDAPVDRLHPRKCRRPVAAGQVTPVGACMLASVLALAGILLAARTLPGGVVLAGAVYLGNAAAYGLALKHEPILDVLSIAGGFVVRILGGCYAIGAEPSSWILVCGFSLALVLGFGKRQAEIVLLDPPRPCRPVLRLYSRDKLNVLLGVTASVCLLSYMLYAVAPETVARHHTDKLVYTVPFVAYGLFRYIFQVQDGSGDGAVEVILGDRPLLINGILWGLAVAAILYCKGV